VNSASAWLQEWHAPCFYGGSMDDIVFEEFKNRVRERAKTREEQRLRYRNQFGKWRKLAVATIAVALVCAAGFILFHS
jgi:hypothetical protein